MKVITTCEDDFILINKCGCIPCSWKDAEKLNQKPCIDKWLYNISHG